MDEGWVNTSQANAVAGMASGGLMLASVVAVALVAPTEVTMGEAQRVLYVHVSVAWLGLLAFVFMAVMGMLYLWCRAVKLDFWAQAAAELGWLCSTLTLITGSLWAHEAWGTWWTWDPRLTTSSILWMFYSGCLMVRGSLRDVHRRARLSGVLAIVGLLDIPLVLMATRWFRGIHPVSPHLEPAMQVVLILCVVSFTAFVSTLLVRRAVQLELEHLMSELIRQRESRSASA